MKKIQIRKGVFETNSSSTHSLTIVPQSEYERWKNEFFYMNPWGNGRLYTREEAIEKISLGPYWDTNTFPTEEDEINEILLDEGFQTYEQFWNSEYLEGYSKNYTTVSGDEIVAFGLYGRDG